MAEYIEREAATKAACDAVWYGGGAPSITEAINKIPSADVAPVRHGYWRRGGNGRAKRGTCSLCGEVQWASSKYCPNCGARMDGEKK